MIISVGAEKAFDKIQHHVIILNKLGIKGSFLNLIKGIYEKPTDNIILKSKGLKTFSLRSDTRQRCHFCHFYSTLY